MRRAPNSDIGDLTAKVLNGTSTTIAVNAGTNQLTNSNYDLNGNMLTGVGATFTYDGASRGGSVTEVSGGTEYFGYSPDNKLVYRNTAAGVEEITFYGAYGEKLWNSSTGSYLWFAGRLIADGNSAVFQDRVGTNRSNGQYNFSYPFTCFDGIACGARYYPYGDEITSTPNERTKFGSYYRDSFTEVDYADQRWYASAYGRFMTADPYRASGGPKSPASWNRYSYTRGDSVNRYDPRGLDDCDPDDPSDCVCDSDGQNCYACDPDAPDCENCANPIDPDAPGPCLPPPTVPSPPPPCWQNTTKIYTTVTDIGANILAIFQKDYTPGQHTLIYDLNAISSVIDGAIDSEWPAASTPASAPSSSVYIGGHFDLNLNIAELRADLGGDFSEFQSDFNWAGDGTRQQAITGSSPNVTSYYLHSKNGRGSTPAILISTSTGGTA